MAQSVFVSRACRRKVKLLFQDFDCYLNPFSQGPKLASNPKSLNVGQHGALARVENELSIKMYALQG